MATTNASGLKGSKTGKDTIEECQKQLADKAAEFEIYKKASEAKLDAATEAHKLEVVGLKAIIEKQAANV